MSRLEDLREVSDHTLHGLTAGDALKYRILQKASGNQASSGRKNIFHAVPVFCGVLAVLLLMVIGLNSLQAVRPSAPGKINTFAAGSSEKSDDRKSSDSPFPEGFKADAVVSLALSGAEPVTDQDEIARLLKILADKAVPADPSGIEADRRLTLTAGDGTVYVFDTDGHFLTGGGTWSCPEFFAEFGSSAGE